MSWLRPSCRSVEAESTHTVYTVALLVATRLPHCVGPSATEEPPSTSPGPFRAPQPLFLMLV